MHMENEGNQNPMSSAAVKEMASAAMQTANRTFDKCPFLEIKNPALLVGFRFQEIKDIKREARSILRRGSSVLEGTSVLEGNCARDLGPFRFYAIASGIFISAILASLSARLRLQALILYALSSGRQLSASLGIDLRAARSVSPKVRADAR